jgi:alkanesulfonate monooxygenase SsuD/methylene tetrahydromethanopterin reductase-like flavin-dependent oxidoreductase (luciferase family)
MAKSIRAAQMIAAVMRRAGTRFCRGQMRLPVHHIFRDGGRRQACHRHQRAGESQGAHCVGAYTVAHVVCRPTDAEAEAYYERYAVTMADHEAVDIHMAGKKEFSQSHDRRTYDLHRQRFAGGAGSYPLVGSPQKITDGMIAIAGQGYEGIALSFVNYTQELPYFCNTVLPMLKEAGYRE